MLNRQEQILAIVITTCTNRKRKPVASRLHAGDLKKGGITQVAAEWGERLGEACQTYPASSLYGGRSFRDSMVAAEKVGAELLIVSAGLGLVSARTQVPSYACTVLSGAADSIAAPITEGFSRANWWKELGQVSPHTMKLADVADCRTGLIMAALSDGYIEMMLEEFLTLPEGRRGDLRLFTRTPRERIPAQLQPFLMPYDDRLDGPDSPIRGTRSDFAARALLHFVDSILSSDDDRSANQHADAVERAAKDWAEPPVFSRRRLSDDEIRQLMRRHWLETNGSTTKLLRLFRDELDIACEQGRFASLAREIRSEVSHG